VVSTTASKSWILDQYAFEEDEGAADAEQPSANICREKPPLSLLSETEELSQQLRRVEQMIQHQSLLKSEQRPPHSRFKPTTMQIQHQQLMEQGLQTLKDQAKDIRYRLRDADTQPPSVAPLPMTHEQPRNVPSGTLTNIETETGPTPQQQRLATLDTKIKEEESILHDEANAYMRSKAETKELQKQIGKLKKQAKALRGKIEKETIIPAVVPAVEPPKPLKTAELAQPLKHETTKHDNADTEETEVGGLFDMFDEESAAPAPSTEPTTTAAPLFPTIPKTWTGKTPKKLLEDYCQKHALSARYSTTHSNGVGGVRVDLVPRKNAKQKHNKSQTPKTKSSVNEHQSVSVTENGPHYSNLDGQHAVATRTLYRLTPTHPVYRVLPPHYRDVWLDWLREIREEKSTEQGKLVEEHSLLLDGLVDYLRAGAVVAVGKESPITATPVETILDTDTDEQPEPTLQEEPVADAWDDSDDEEATRVIKQPIPKPRITQKREQPPPPTHAPTTETPTVNLGIMSQQRTQQHQNSKRFQTTRRSKPYQTMLKQRQELPMFKFRQKLLDTIVQNPVTVLCGETGCGKTTQCPQYILEQALFQSVSSSANQHPAVSILCTQPRRISAISIAERVSDEMCCRQVGNLVGYHIRLESRKSPNTQLLFCTTGVVLRRLQDDPELIGVSHVIVDEVHERQWQIDLLLISLRHLVNTTRKDLKVVLMSATLDAKLFCQFFGNNTPFVSVPGRTFPVQSYFLEDVIEATHHVIEENSKCALSTNSNRSADQTSLWVTGRGGTKRREMVSLAGGDGSHLDMGNVSDDYPDYSLSTRRMMDRANERVINYDLIQDLLELLLLKPESNTIILPPPQTSATPKSTTQNNGNGNSTDSTTCSPRIDGATLIFLPGLGEIRNLSERLKGSRIFGKRQEFEIIAMHSSLSPADQKRAFLPCRHDGQRKIIIATNIAETSVTIPDVVCVIDSGFVKEVRQNKRSFTTSMLVTDWCSKASAKQRQGRAGRVQPGICCKLYSSRTLSTSMNDQAMPEIQRVPLEEICLSILASGISNNCFGFLQQAPQPPTEEIVNAALGMLAEVGAITMHNADTNSSSVMQTLTPLGRHLSKIPVDVSLGKMLIFGALFDQSREGRGCLDPILTIAASLSAKSPFVTNVDDAQLAAAAHKPFKHNSSDFITICNVYNLFRKASMPIGNGIVGDTSRSFSSVQGRRWAEKNYLNFAALMEITDSRNQFLDLLIQIGFVKRNSSTAMLLDSRSRNNQNNHHEQNRNTSTTTDKNNKILLHSPLSEKTAKVVSALICAGQYPKVAHVTKPIGGVPNLSYKKERVHFHSSSINHKNNKLESDWVVFHEKFATSKTYISTTSPVSPYSLLLFGGSVEVKHVDRKVNIDDWIYLNASGKTGALFRTLRDGVQRVLKEMTNDMIVDENSLGGRVVNGVVELLAYE